VDHCEAQGSQRACQVFRAVPHRPRCVPNDG
jgi:hypothetical protein